MKIAIRFNKDFFDLPNRKYYLQSIFQLGYECFIISRDEEEQKQIEQICTGCVVQNISDFNSNDFKGAKDVVVGDVEFVEPIKFIASHVFLLESKTNWDDLYNHLWNEVR